jgi:ABC-type branched-subunit amino acid transport system ATPase component
MTFKVVINQISYSKTPILLDINLSINSGEIIGLIGHNGCGKSTLLRSIVGIHQEWDGYIQLGSTKINIPEPSLFRKLGITYLPQLNVIFENLSLIDNIRAAQLPIKSLSKNEASKLLIADLEHKKNDIASTLSGGERQLLGISMVLASNPKVLLLDEPCASLAPETAQNFLQRLKASVKDKRISVLIAEQRIPELLEIVDNVAVIDDRHLAFLGGIDEFLRTDHAPKLNLNT